MGTIPFAFWGPQGVAIPPTMVAYYKMNDVTGNATDTFASKTMTENGTVGSAAGKIGTSRGVFSSSNYFNRSDSAFNLAAIGVSLWFKTSSSASFEVLIARQHTNGTGWALYKYNNDKIAFETNGTGLSSTSTWADNTWHHLFAANRVTSGANEKRIYIDGTLEGQAAGNANTDAGVYVSIGYQGTQYAYASGYIDEIAVFDFSGSPPSWDSIVSDYIIPIYDSGAGSEFE